MGIVTAMMAVLKELRGQLSAVVPCSSSRLRAGKRITSGFHIPSSRCLRPLLNREILTVAQLRPAVSFNRRDR